MSLGGSSLMLLHRPFCSRSHFPPCDCCSSDWAFGACPEGIWGWTQVYSCAGLLGLRREDVEGGVRMRVSATARSDCYTGVEEWSLWSDESRFTFSLYHWELQDLGQIASPTWNSVPHSVPHPPSGLPWKQNSIWTWVAQPTVGFALRKWGRLSGRFWFWWECEVEIFKSSNNSYRIVRSSVGCFVFVFNVNCLYLCSSSKWGSI